MEKISGTASGFKCQKYETPADLIAMLNQTLEKWEIVYGNEKKDRSPEERFAYVIERAYEQAGCGVVVLVTSTTNPCCKPSIMMHYWKIIAKL